MKIFKKNRSKAMLGLIAVVLVTVTCTCPIPFPKGSTTPTPTPTPTPLPVLGDYGDAPDGNQNMDTGYYAPTGGPFFFTYGNAGVASNFPTMGDDRIPGPYTIDVDEFWIGPLFGGSTAADIPSIEDDADDVNDPDNVPNLNLQTNRADCDKENGSHDPAGNNCMPVPAWSIPMNARLVIFFGYPPLGVWITSVHASENMTYDGPIYWNLAFDLNQNGNWDGGDEWVSQDVVVNLSPGETKTLISPAFRFPTSGTPWGRLKFPIWVRSMVTSESIQGKLGSGDWDGRGTEDGFKVGEVEDYFVEWQPIGQILPNKEPGQASGCSLLASENLERIPTDRRVGDILQLVPGEEVDEVQILIGEDLEEGGEVFPSGPIILNSDGVGPFLVGENEWSISVEDRNLSVVPDPFYLTEMLKSYVVIFPLRDELQCSGSATVGITPGIYHVFGPAIPLEVGGTYTVVSAFDSGDKSHSSFVRGEHIVSIFVQTGSITFSGNDPFVTVSGERNEEDGSFFAEGRGVVAGYPEIAVVFEGTLAEGNLSGLYTMGAEGGLPGGQSITYEITGSKSEEPGEVPESGPAPLPQGIEEAIESFVEIFNGAFQDGDPEPLYQLLNPAVIELYGEEACQAYLEGIVEIPTTLEYLDAIKVGAWDWERDGVTIPVEFAYAVQGNFTSQGQTLPQELHLTLPGDDSVRWFTDCGDPIQ